MSAFEIFGKIGGGELKLSVIDSHVRGSLCVSNGSIYSWVTMSKIGLKCRHGGKDAFNGRKDPNRAELGSRSRAHLDVSCQE